MRRPAAAPWPRSGAASTRPPSSAPSEWRSSPAGIPATPTGRPHWKRCTNPPAKLCGYGQERGIALTCEVFDRDIDKKCLIGPSDYAAAYAREVRRDYPDFGLMYDLSHQPLLFEQSAEALTVLKDYLVHIHVGNAVVTPGVPGYGDLHPRFGWPGGANDVPELTEFLAGLFAIGYLKEGAARPWVGFEVKPQGAGETSELIIVGTKRVWQDAWSWV